MAIGLLSMIEYLGQMRHIVYILARKKEKAILLIVLYIMMLYGAMLMWLLIHFNQIP